MSRFVFSLSIAALGLAGVASSACTNHVVVVTHPELVTMNATCTKTVCDAIDVATPVTDECKQCWVSCTESLYCGDPKYECADRCQRPYCEDRAACAEHAWVGNLQNVSPTPAVGAACHKAYADVAMRCSWKVTDDVVAHENDDCARAAISSIEAAVPYWACLGASECGHLALDCGQPSTFGDELCSMRGASCLSHCGDDGHDGFDALGSRLKPAFLAAAKACLNKDTCEEVNGCLDAWRKLVD